MKKLIVLIGMMFFVMSNALAQKGIQTVGVHLAYGTEIKSVGLGIKYQNNITDAIRFEPSINYFFEKDNLDMFDINFNAHYLLPLDSNVRVYPLAGLTYTRWSWDSAASEGWDLTQDKFGVNLGAGAEFDIADEWLINFELKYQLVKDFDQAVFNIGVAYMF